MSGIEINRNSNPNTAISFDESAGEFRFERNDLLKRTAQSEMTVGEVDSQTGDTVGFTWRYDSANNEALLEDDSGTKLIRQPEAAPTEFPQGTGLVSPNSFRIEEGSSNYGNFFDVQVSDGNNLTNVTDISAKNIGANAESYVAELPSSGSYTLRFEYKKNSFTSDGQDRVYIINLEKPDGTTIDFTSGLPQGFNVPSGANNGWSVVSGDDIPGDQAVLASDDIGNDESAIIEYDLTADTDGFLSIDYIVSTEPGYDVFDFKIDGTTKFRDSGFTLPHTGTSDFGRFEVRGESPLIYSGANDVSIGLQAGERASTPINFDAIDSNVVIGNRSGFETHTSRSLFIGSFAGNQSFPIENNNSSISNVGVGYGAFARANNSEYTQNENTAGLPFNNTAVGAFAGRQSVTQALTAFGKGAAYNFPGGKLNIFIGVDAGAADGIAAGGETRQEKVSGSIVIGSASFATKNNQLVIGGPKENPGSRNSLQEAIIGQGPTTKNPNALDLRMTDVRTTVRSSGDPTGVTDRKASDLNIYTGRGVGFSDGTHFSVNTSVPTTPGEAKQETREQLFVDHSTYDVKTGDFNVSAYNRVSDSQDSIFEAKVQVRSVVATPELTKTEATSGNLDGSTAIDYAVVARDSNGNQTLRSPIATIQNIDPTALDSNNFITVNWQAAEGSVSDYIVVKDEGQTGTFVQVGSAVSSGATTFANVVATTFDDTGQSTSSFTAANRNETASASLVVNNTGDTSGDIQIRDDSSGDLFSLDDGSSPKLAIKYEGNGAFTIGKRSTEFASGTGTDSITIGSGTKEVGGSTIGNEVDGNRNIAIGSGNLVRGSFQGDSTDSIAIGTINNIENSTESILIGGEDDSANLNEISNATKSLGIGYGNVFSGNSFSFLLGKSNTNNASNSFGIGLSNTIENVDSSFAVGSGNTVSSDNSYILGRDSTVNDANSYAIGKNNSVTTQDSYVLGQNNSLEASRETYVIGNDNDILNFGPESIIVGFNSTVSESDSFVFGKDIESAGANVVLGNGNVTLSDQKNISLSVANTVSTNQNSLVLQNFSDVTYLHTSSLHLGYGGTLVDDKVSGFDDSSTILGGGVTFSGTGSSISSNDSIFWGTNSTIDTDSVDAFKSSVMIESFLGGVGDARNGNFFLNADYGSNTGSDPVGAVLIHTNITDSNEAQFSDNPSGGNVTAFSVNNDALIVYRTDTVSDRNKSVALATGSIETAKRSIGMAGGTASADDSVAIGSTTVSSSSTVGIGNNTFIDTSSTDALLVQDSGGIGDVFSVDTSNGEVQATQVFADSASVGDDAVTSFTPSQSFGKIVVQDGSGNVAEFLYDISNGAITKASDLTGVFTTSTSSLGGTTGTDGDITVSADSTNGEIDIENRTGSTKTFRWHLVG